MVTTDDPFDRTRDEAARAAWGYVSPGESRWPPTVAVLVALVLQTLLPERLTVGPNWVIPAFELAMLGPLTIARDRHDWLIVRRLSVLLIAVVNAANVASLALLIDSLLNGSKSSGRQLVFAAVGIWLTSIIVFSLWYWEIDRGGPGARTREDHGPPDFLFPNMTLPSATAGEWAPTYVDYLYVSLANSMAFSPADTVPLTSRAKLLMGSQALVSLATVAVVGARAVNILS